MRFAPAFLLGALAWSSVACLRTTEFHCTTSADCGPGGTCQTAVGFCSVSDGDCPGAQRYGDSAGTYAGQCVGGTPPMDAPSGDATLADAPPSDAPSDSVSVGCPAGYNEITGGQTGHRYRLVTSTANWSNQRDFCTSTSASAYLAIPDDAGELAAMVDLATSTQFWVGISDQAVEGTWRNTKDVVQTFLPWAPNRPNMSSNNSDDCVVGVDNGASAATITDERCGSTQLPAICECEP
ncbi:MAG TPA: C-type lectin domain-containing protein [Kofleriaceae bacterium]|jgi:hypothetical protein|nr:C-type lectin domain-containing protein [Kofleriaceae bacterium]